MCKWKKSSWKLFCLEVTNKQFTKKVLLYPCEWCFWGIKESLCLPFCLCRFVSGQLLYFGLTLVYHIWHTGVCVAYICDLDTNRHLTSRSNLLDLLRCFHVHPVKTYCNWFFLLLRIFDKEKKDLLILCCFIIRSFRLSWKDLL